MEVRETDFFLQRDDVANHGGNSVTSSVLLSVTPVCFVVMVKRHYTMLCISTDYAHVCVVCVDRSTDGETNTHTLVLC